MNYIEKKELKTKMERQLLKAKISTLKSLPFSERKHPFWELLYTFLQVLQKANLT